MKARRYLHNPSNGKKPHVIADRYDRSALITLYHGDCRELLASIPNHEARLVVTSPPYNIGKPYERKLDLNAYLQQQREIITYAQV